MCSRIGKRRVLCYAIAIIVMLIALGMIARELMVFVSPNPAANRELQSLYYCIRIGDSRAAVEDKVAKIRKILQVHEIDNSTLLIQTPVTIGAKNWILFILFNNDAVSCLRFGSSDEPKIRPVSAPANRGVSP